MSGKPRYVALGNYEEHPLVDLVMCERCGAVVHVTTEHLHDHFHATVASHGRDISQLAGETGTELVRA